MPKHPAISSIAALHNNGSFSYPGDTETFGSGSSFSQALGLKRLGIHHEILQPGDRSSWPHAHSDEEEFILVLAGHPQIWIDGEVYDLQPGDCVGFAAGTGHAHTLLNNSEHPVMSIVVGERLQTDDKIFYPKHPARNQACKEGGFFWENHPHQDLGPHDGWTDAKRPGQEPER